MAGSLRTVFRVLVGDSKEEQLTGCTLTATLVPKGPALESTLTHIRTETGLNPEVFALVVRVKCDSQELAETTVNALRETYDTNKAQSELGRKLMEMRIETVFQATDSYVHLTLRLTDSEAMSAMFSMIEAQVPDIFTQPSKVTLQISTSRDLTQASSSDLHLIYSLFEGSRLEITMELWRGLLPYIRDRTRDMISDPDLVKVMVMAGIYARGNVELKLRGAQAIPAEIRDKLTSYSSLLSAVKNSYQSDALLSGVVTALSNCQANADLAVLTSIGAVTAQLQLPGLSGVFLKPS